MATDTPEIRIPGDGPELVRMGRMVRWTSGLFALFMLGMALFSDSSPETRAGHLIGAMIFAVSGWAASNHMRRQSKGARLTAEGIEGPGLPGCVAWSDIQGVVVRSAPVMLGMQHFIGLDVGNVDAYLKRQSLDNQAARLGLRLAGARVPDLPPLVLFATALNVDLGWLAGEIRSRAGLPVEGTAA